MVKPICALKGFRVQTEQRKSQECRACTALHVLAAQTHPQQHGQIRFGFSLCVEQRQSGQTMKHDTCLLAISSLSPQRVSKRLTTSPSQDNPILLATCEPAARGWPIVRHAQQTHRLHHHVSDVFFSQQSIIIFLASQFGWFIRHSCFPTTTYDPHDFCKE